MVSCLPISSHAMTDHAAMLAEGSNDQDRLRIKRGTYAAGLSLHSHHQEKQALKLVAR